jgi:hypothetical protein
MTADLKRYWPAGQTSLLMKAAFHSDIRVAGQAWRSWLKICDFDKTFWSDLRVASLAHRRLGRSGDAGALEPRIRGLRRYNWSSGRMRIDAARPLLIEFADKNVTFMPIKGSALFARDPQAMKDRFIADIDVLVHHASWENAVNIALDQGWQTQWRLERNVAVHRMWQTHHSLDLQRGAHGAVDLHQFSLLLNRQLGADAMLWKRAVPGTLSGIPVVLPDPSDHLAIIFGHCFMFADPRSFDWVADALATMSAPGFDWCLFTDVVLDRELAVPAATALTYLAEELQHSIPSDVIERIARQAREPFLSEFAACYRTHVSEVAEECRAIYEAECIRSRRFLGRVSSPREISDRQNQINVTQIEITAGQKVVLPMPSGVRPTDRVQFRLLLEVADEWRKTSSLVLGTSALVLLRCFDRTPLELGRLVVRRKQSRPQELRGEIDGSLVVGRGIDELWLHVAVEAPWLHKLRARIVRFGTNGAQEAVWLRKLRRLRALSLGFRGNRTRVANGRRNGIGGANWESESEGAILRGSFEAKISTSHSWKADVSGNEEKEGREGSSHNSIMQT